MRTGTAPNPARRLLATVLACEAIVIALAIPVAVTVLDVDGATAAGVCGGLAVVCVVMAGLLRFPWAVPVGTVVQVLVIATGFMVPPCSSSVSCSGRSGRRPFGWDARWGARSRAKFAGRQHSVRPANFIYRLFRTSFSYGKCACGG
ncbi:DUF4233 domain-containing protein [Actinomadura madurae]|uniref:DUF4233 domain-containing protein n=1 Tax=Actinomadura madurae TaxID=1993 RepID=UPI0020D2509D|nr:DUF4233 domain-containing protein [Actinomadura madurae]MCP9966301.1 DUF4233 domain-containing protein [Actinomadura madurae]MCP9978792.1 DUF4233 domain-containing protein [Actinomadura madurae]MCQ0014977.1 DUF4233 domain-containing protein [Actinomadura madurae]